MRAEQQRILIKCMNTFCDTVVETIRLKQSQGIYCPSCRKEAKRIDDRNCYHRNVEHTRARKRASELNRSARHDNDT